MLNLIREFVVGVLVFFTSLLTGNSSVVVPTSIPSPTPTMIQTIPSPTPTKLVQKVQMKPSDRSLKVAGSIYFLYTDEGMRQKIREKYGITKSDDSKEIIELAFWFDKHTGELAKIEAAIDDYKTRLSRPYVDQSAPKSINCTTNTIGSYTYTRCF